MVNIDDIHEKKRMGIEINNFEEYAEHKKIVGKWPRTKEEVYNDARNIAINDAAKAIGMQYGTLKGMIDAN